MKGICDQIEITYFHAARSAGSGFDDGHPSNQRGSGAAVNAGGKIRPRSVCMVSTLHDQGEVGVGHDTCEVDDCFAWVAR